MPGATKDSEPTFEEFKKEMDAFFADFEKRLKALKLDPKLTSEARKCIIPVEKCLIDWAKKNCKNQPIPLQKLPSVANKSFKKLPWLHITAAPGGHDSIPDGVKFSVGSKSISAGFKVKYDSKKEQLKFEPVATLKFSF